MIRKSNRQIQEAETNEPSTADTPAATKAKSTTGDGDAFWEIPRESESQGGGKPEGKGRKPNPSFHNTLIHPSLSLTNFIVRTRDRIPQGAVSVCLSV